MNINECIRNKCIKNEYLTILCDLFGMVKWDLLRDEKVTAWITWWINIHHRDPITLWEWQWNLNTFRFGGDYTPRALLIIWRSVIASLWIHPSLPPPKKMDSLMKGIRIPNHRNPNHPFTISWFTPPKKDHQNQLRLSMHLGPLKLWWPCRYGQLVLDGWSPQEPKMPDVLPNQQPKPPTQTISWVSRSLQTKKTTIQLDSRILVGDWTNPFEKYCIIISPGVKIHHIWKHQLQKFWNIHRKIKGKKKIRKRYD